MRSAKAAGSMRIPLASYPSDPFQGGTEARGVRGGPARATRQVAEVAGPEHSSTYSQL